ncbi:unnamed protein product [Rangifer tarandus platyrhynchus]|uniref:Uncharacterized protein n=2 Tax=Rangifer tarandus platyrhynchus TaxID=3082113 RepID=A0ABN8ZJ71_RANTA|nr:unnamed protein product [Rangifer tarandus platyrhynchus]CAI9708565.1 unnamed protein product [Rangifer tarandus platyrhynchus]
MTGASSWGGAWRPLPCPAAPVLRAAKRKLAAAAATSCPYRAPAPAERAALRSGAPLVSGLRPSVGSPGPRVRSAGGARAGTPGPARARTEP